ncbi:MAG: hypothetical protein ACI4BI_00620 [Anaerotardibacter sp.]
MKKKFLCLLAAFALVLALPMSAFAAGSAFDENEVSGSSESIVVADETTGNSLFIDHTASNVSTKSDFYWFGSTLAASNLNVGTSGNGSLLAAGSSLSFSNCQVADSVRVAGSNLSFDNLTAGNNITVAGSSISFGKGTIANGLYVAGSSVAVEGTYNGVVVAAGTIAVDNVVCSGNMALSGETITVGPNVSVTGTLEVPEAATVEIAEGASVANLVKVENDELEASVNQAPGIDVVQIAYSCIAHILIVGLLFWLMRERLEKMAQKTTENWGKTILIGLATFFLLPLVLIVACLPLVTIPIVFLIFVAMVVIWLCAIPFAGAALGKVFFKNMKPLYAGILLTVILTVLACLPYMTIAVDFVCTVVTVGYIMQALNDLRKRRKEEKLQSIVPVQNVDSAN